MTTGNQEDSLEYVAISLWISSDELPPEEITQIVAIEPTYIRERGAPTRTGLMRRPEFDVFEWQFREQPDIKPGDYVGNHTERFITEFLAKIKDAAPRVRELSEKNSVLISLVYHVHDIPHIGLTHQNLEVIASLGASLDYDIMFAQANDEKE